DVSSAQHAAHQEAWFPSAHEDRVGPRRALASAEEGAQAPRSAPPLEAREPLTGERFSRRVRLARGSDLAACWDEGRRLHSMHTDVAWRPNQGGYPPNRSIVPRLPHHACAPKSVPPPPRRDL